MGESHWFRCPLFIGIEDVGFTSFADWCLYWLVDNKDIDDIGMSLIEILYWEVWKSRCANVFQKVKVNPFLSCSRAVVLVHDFWFVSDSGTPSAYSSSVNEVSRNK